MAPGNRCTPRIPGVLRPCIQSAACNVCNVSSQMLAAGGQAPAHSVCIEVVPGGQSWVGSHHTQSEPVHGFDLAMGFDRPRSARAPSRRPYSSNFYRIESTNFLLKWLAAQCPRSSGKFPDQTPHWYTNGHGVFTNPCRLSSKRSTSAW